MDDFLIGREVISNSNPGQAESEGAVTLPPLEDSANVSVVPDSPLAEPGIGAHGTRVETVVERGRVTKLIVSCTCGNVTEIECRY